MSARVTALASPAVAAPSAAGRFSFVVFCCYTLILVGRPQDYIPVLEPLRLALLLTVLSPVVTLVSGPVNVPDPPGVKVVKVESAREMLAAVEKALPADVAVFAAAVADWRVAEPSRQKMKKASGKPAPELAFVENPDILATVARRKSKRPELVIGFAAETEKVIDNAKAKLARKGSDWIVANDVSTETGIMGGDRNTVHLVTSHGVESWPPQSKEDVAKALVERMAAALAGECK